MEKTVNHSFKEFKGFNWNLLREGEWPTSGETTDGRHYSLFKGGSGYRGGFGWGISIVDEELNQETWEFPPFFSRLLDWMETQGKKAGIAEVRQTFQDFLKLINPQP